MPNSWPTEFSFSHDRSKFVSCWRNYLCNSALNPLFRPLLVPDREKSRSVLAEKHCVSHLEVEMRMCTVVVLFVLRGRSLDICFRNFAHPLHPGEGGDRPIFPIQRFLLVQDIMWHIRIPKVGEEEGRSLRRSSHRRVIGELHRGQKTFPLGIIWIVQHRCHDFDELPVERFC